MHLIWLTDSIFFLCCPQTHHLFTSASSINLSHYLSHSLLFSPSSSSSHLDSSTDLSPLSLPPLLASPTPSPPNSSSYSSRTTGSSIFSPALSHSVSDPTFLGRSGLFLPPLPLFSSLAKSLCITNNHCPFFFVLHLIWLLDGFLALLHKPRLLGIYIFSPSGGLRWNF